MENNLTNTPTISNDIVTDNENRVSLFLGTTDHPRTIYSAVADILHYYAEKGYIQSGEIKSDYECLTKTEYIDLKIKRKQ